MVLRIVLAVAVQAILLSSVQAETPHEFFADASPAECNKCHLDNKVATNHGALWTLEHGPYADKKTSLCAACHEQSECLDCHYGGGIGRDLHSSTSGADYMPKSHRSDFRELHPLKAKESPQSCVKCHDERAYCARCHEKFNNADLSVLSHRKGFSNLEVESGGPRHSSFAQGQCANCHPDSVLPKHEWSASHAREARKNLTSCRACHPEGAVCLNCHSAKTGLGRNPHPKDWSSIAPKLEGASNRRTCNKCH